MKYILATVLLMMSFVVQTNYAQQQPVSLPSATRIVETEPFIRTELFFGRNRPNGIEVSQEEFADFLNVTITPEFPDGLTVLDGIGQFRDSNGNTIQEKAKVLILLYPSNTKRQSSRKIERIRTAYKNRFEQQSVLRVDDVLPLRVSF
ncbi:MAG: DUF3574 domain-containing protein [Acidobacteriota bacterium]|nr:DUF3574 domain-containing protein [Acidobacteriota bacterium]